MQVLVLIEHLLCASHCSRYGMATNKTDKQVLRPHEVYILRSNKGYNIGQREKE